MTRPADVVLFGEALIDQLMPARNVPGGAPFNVAWHLRALGVDPLLVSCLGDDADGEMLREAAARRGLDTRGLQTDGKHPTGRVIVHQDRSGPRFEISPAQAWDFIDAEAATRVVRDEPPGILYFGTLAQRGRMSRWALAKILHLDWKKRFLDLNLRAPWFDSATVQGSLASADVVKANEDELRVACDLLGLEDCGREDGAPQRADALIARFGLRKVLVTRGADGAWLFGTNGARVGAGGAPLGDDFADTVGAGDAFSAVLILGCLKGWAAPTTLVRADDFARAICRIPGAIPEDDAFYRQFLEAWSAGGRSSSP